MKITLLVDNMNSWYCSYAQNLKTELENIGHEVFLVNSVDNVETGELAFFLSCEKLIKKDIRDKNKHNLVVHSSDLPQGKGWSPLTWSVLAGENKITNTLFEAVDKVDAGVIYMQNSFEFEGHELFGEMRKLQGEKINELVLNYVSKYPEVQEKEQIGEESFFKKRGAEDSELDTEQSIKDQFNLLRVVDNEKYPAFFEHLGKKYILKIYKADEK